MAILIRFHISALGIRYIYKFSVFAANFSSLQVAINLSPSRSSFGNFLYIYLSNFTACMYACMYILLTSLVKPQSNCMRTQQITVKVRVPGNVCMWSSIITCHHQTPQHVRFHAKTTFVMFCNHVHHCHLSQTPCCQGFS